MKGTVCVQFMTGSMSKETWRAAESARDRGERDRKKGGGKKGRRWQGKAVTDNIVVLQLPQGQTRRRERTHGNET